MPTTSPMVPSSSSGSGKYQSNFSLNTSSTHSTFASPHSRSSSKNHHSAHKIKNRLKPKKGQLVQETIPLNDIRRNYPRMVAAMLNRGHLEDCESKLSSMCTEDSSSFILVLSAIEKENPYGPVYQEVHGVAAAARLLCAYFSAIPDAVFSISDCKFFKRLPGSEIHCSFTFSGSMIHRIVVEGADQQDDLSGAIVGLHALAQVALNSEYLQVGDTESTGEGESGDEEEEEDDEDTSESESAEKAQSSDESSGKSHILVSHNSTADCSSATANAVDSLATESVTGRKRSLSSDLSSQSQAPTSLIVPTGKRRVAVGEMDVLVDSASFSPFSCIDQMLVSTEKTRFRAGERMPNSRSFLSNGRLVFVINSDKRIQKLEVHFSSQMAVQTSKFLSDVDLER